MKITKIKLHNIGPYKDTDNVFDLDVNKGKNIILIGGKNGAGKTTLLNSIKIGLFGTYAFGLRTDSAIYYKSLKQLFNYVETKKKVSVYAIEISFELIENYITNKYVFSRSWKKVGDDISENFRVIKNNVYLQAEDIEQIQTKLKEIMPPSVIDTMLFDGEKIAQIIDDDKISEYLKEIINVNFNINIFDKMEDDINLYIEKEKNRKAFTADEILVIEARNKYNAAVKKLKSLNDIEDKYKKSLDSEKFKLKNLMKKFENYGGLTDAEKFSMRSSLEMLENSRRENLAVIKEFLEDDIVFYLNKDKINSISKSISKEKPAILLKYLNEIENYLNNGKTKNIKKELLDIVGSDDFKIRFNASPKLIAQIDNLNVKFNGLPVDTIKQILISSRDDLNNSKIYKRIIGNNENANSNDLKKLLKEIKGTEIEIEELKSKLSDNEKDLKKAEADSNSALIELETLEVKIDSEKKEENSFNIARKLLKISSDYKQKQVKDYLSKISTLAVKKFEEINKKENYISRISIAYDTYNIKLYDNNDIEKSVQILSAGEKQLLISAIVWAIFKLADRNNMFTFDTPLARLDKENRSLFVERILCTISDQVLILSTDEEIVGSLLKIVSKNVNKKYLLENNEKIGKTTIKEAYFE